MRNLNERPVLIVVLTLLNTFSALSAFGVSNPPSLVSGPLVPIRRQIMDRSRGQAIPDLSSGMPQRRSHEPPISHLRPALIDVRDLSVDAPAGCNPATVGSHHESFERACFTADLLQPSYFPFFVRVRLSPTPSTATKASATVLDYELMP